MYTFIHKFIILIIIYKMSEFYSTLIKEKNIKFNFLIGFMLKFIC